MRCEVTDDPTRFWQWAEGVVLSDPVVHNVLATVVHSRRALEASTAELATYVVVRDEAGAGVGAALCTPPHPAVLSRLPERAVEPLVEALSGAAPDIPGVMAPSAEATAFARAWTRRSGGVASIAMKQRVYQLDSVKSPPPAAGACRVARAADRDLLLDWHTAFYADVGEEGVDLAGTVDRRLAAGDWFVWDVDGAPVSYAGRHLPVAGVVRIGPVYTPPQHRGRGYASNLVGAMSQQALDEGAHACCLFTDLDNPTSNKIYTALGYKPVSDLLRFHFS